MVTCLLLPFRIRCSDSFSELKAGWVLISSLWVEIRNKRWTKCVGKGMWL